MSRIPWRVGDRYELLSQLGAGPSCAVWRGRDLVTGAELAIKVLRPEVVQYPDAFDGLRLTLGRVAALGHPGIAEVGDTVVQDGWAALVGRLVPGGSLRGLLEHGGPIPPERAAALAQ